jgi:hypothetical protein
MDNPETQAIILPVSLGCPFFVLFVFVLCLMPNIACVSGLSILCFICLRPVSCARMDNPETQAILGTRHRTKTNKTKNGQPRDTSNINHKIQKEDK